MKGLVLSLFPGLGLLDTAFQLEGWCVVKGPDILWGDNIDGFSVPASRFDGVIGGPPCQAFSPIGNMNRARRSAENAEEKYRGAELLAIENNYLSGARARIAEAKDQRVERYAPKTLARAESLLTEAETSLQRRRQMALIAHLARRLILRVA